MYNTYMLKNKFLSFVLFFIITYSASFIGGFVTVSLKEPWYSQLIKSNYNKFYDKLNEAKVVMSNRYKSKGGVIFDKFIINHVSSGKDWERLIFVGINENEEDMRVIWFTKDDFNNHIQSDKSLFNVQQGGKGVGNDDYICTKVESLLQCDWVKSINLW